MIEPFWRTLTPNPKPEAPVYYSSKTGKRVGKSFGEKNGRSVLNKALVDQLREEFANTATTTTELHKKYQISRRQVDRVLKYEDWRY
jgi:Mor family transcriptional regulator